MVDVGAEKCHGTHQELGYLWNKIGLLHTFDLDVHHFSVHLLENLFHQRMVLQVGHSGCPQVLDGCRSP